MASIAHDPRIITDDVKFVCIPVVNYRVRAGPPVVVFIYVTSFKKLAISELLWLQATSTSILRLFISCVKLEAKMLVLMI